MKKFIAVVLTVVTVLSCFSIIVGATTNEIILCGDANLNETVEVDDARLCLRYAIKIDSIEEKTEYGLKIFYACDVDNDNEITVGDARNILRIAIGLDESCKKIIIAKEETTTEETTTEETTTAEETTEETTTVEEDVMPTTKEEILDFYKEATNRVASGEVGYTKKEYQTPNNLNLTGISACDSAINNVMGGILTYEENASEQTYEKGWQGAKDSWSANFTLTDYSFIKSTTCIKDGANYKIKIITNSEDTPKRDSSIISNVSQDVLYWEDVEMKLSEYSVVVKEYSDIHINYSSTTIDAEITPDGEIIYLDVVSSIDVSIGSAKIFVATINNKSFHIDTYDKFYNFDYA